MNEDNLPIGYQSPPDGDEETPITGAQVVNKLLHPDGSKDALPQPAPMPDSGPETRFYATTMNQDSKINLNELGNFEGLSPAQAWAKMQEMNCDFASVLLRTKSDGRAIFATFHVAGEFSQKALELLEQWDGDQTPLPTHYDIARRITSKIIAHAPTLWGDHVHDGMITLSLPESVIEDSHAFQAVQHESDKVGDLKITESTMGGEYVDFGYRWRTPVYPDNFRVSWHIASGKLTATPMTYHKDSVVIWLATCHERATVDLLMEGWPELIGEPDSLDRLRIGWTTNQITGATFGPDWHPRPESYKGYSSYDY